MLPSKQEGRLVGVITIGDVLNSCLSDTAGANARSLLSFHVKFPLEGQVTKAGWDAGQVAHLLPTANHDRFLDQIVLQSCARMRNQF